MAPGMQIETMSIEIVDIFLKDTKPESRITTNEDLSKRPVRAASSDDAGAPLQKRCGQDSRDRVRREPAGKISRAHPSGTEERTHGGKRARRPRRIYPTPPAH